MWYPGEGVGLIPEVIPAGDIRASKGGKVMGSVKKKKKHMEALSRNVQ